MAVAGNSVIGIDQLQGQNVMPVSLSIDSLGGGIGESGMAAQLLQGLEGIQLQFTTGSLGQGIQITGLDPSLLSQTVQIDASLLQQLQQQGNLNVTINPNVVTQAMPTDPNLLQGMQGIQIQQAIQEVQPGGVVVQPLTTSLPSSLGGQVVAQETIANSTAQPMEIHLAQDQTIPAHTAFDVSQIQHQEQVETITEVDHTGQPSTDDGLHLGTVGGNVVERQYIHEDNRTIVHEQGTEGMVLQDAQGDAGDLEDLDEGSLSHLTEDQGADMAADMMDKESDPERTHFCTVRRLFSYRGQHWIQHLCPMKPVYIEQS